MSDSTFNVPFTESTSSKFDNTLSYKDQKKINNASLNPSSNTNIDLPFENNPSNLVSKAQVDVNKPSSLSIKNEQNISTNSIKINPENSGNNFSSQQSQPHQSANNISGQSQQLINNSAKDAISKQSTYVVNSNPQQLTNSLTNQTLDQQQKSLLLSSSNTQPQSHNQSANNFNKSQNSASVSNSKYNQQMISGNGPSSLHQNALNSQNSTFAKIDAVSPIGGFNKSLYAQITFIDPASGATGGFPFQQNNSIGANGSKKEINNRNGEQIVNHVEGAGQNPMDALLSPDNNNPQSFSISQGTMIQFLIANPQFLSSFVKNFVSLELVQEWFTCKIADQMKQCSPKKRVKRKSRAEYSDGLTLKCLEVKKCPVPCHPPKTSCGCRRNGNFSNKCQVPIRQAARERSTDPGCGKIPILMTQEEIRYYKSKGVDLSQYELM